MLIATFVNMPWKNKFNTIKTTPEKEQWLKITLRKTKVKNELRYNIKKKEKRWNKVKNEKRKKARE